MPIVEDPSWWDAGSWLLANDIGCDESGSGDILLVTLQLGTVQKATKLKTHWKAELQTAGTLFFHSKDFNHFSGGIFKTLTQEQRTRPLAALSGCIRKNLSVGLHEKSPLVCPTQQLITPALSVGRRMRFSDSDVAADNTPLAR
jgi:hypothetical protein